MDAEVELDRTFETTAKYAERVREVGKDVGVPVVDVWTRIWDAAGHVEEQLSEYSYDGLHLNGRGYAVSASGPDSRAGIDPTQLVYEEIIKAITEHYPELQPEKLKPVFKLYVTVPFGGQHAHL